MIFANDLNPKPKTAFDYIKPIDEAYYGKTKELLAIEKQIGIIRDRYRHNPIRINTSPEMLELNRMMEDTFGFKVFSITISPMMDKNAYTYPVSICVNCVKDIDKNLIISKNGPKYIKEAGYSTMVVVTEGLFLDSRYSDAEILAVILHEIGHNFESALSPTNRGFATFNNIMRLILMPLEIILNPYNAAGVLSSVPLMEKNMRAGLVQFLVDFRTNNAPFYILCQVVYRLFCGVLGIVGAIQNILLAFIRLIGVAIPMVSLYSVITGITNFRNEAIADNFVTMWGYGPELTTALTKMKYSSGGMPGDQLMRSIPFVNVWFDLMNLPYTAIVDVIDCHPNEAFRHKDQIRMLKKELERTDLDPKMKQEIKREIAEIEASMKHTTDMLAKGGGFMFTNLWAATMLSMYDGDIKSYLSRGKTATYEEMDATLRRNEELVRSTKRR